MWFMLNLITYLHIETSKYRKATEETLLTFEILAVDTPVSSPSSHAAGMLGRKRNNL